MPRWPINWQDTWAGPPNLLQGHGRYAERTAGRDGRQPHPISALMRLATAKVPKQLASGRPGRSNFLRFTNHVREWISTNRNRKRSRPPAGPATTLGGLGL